MIYQIEMIFESQCRKKSIVLNNFAFTKQFHIHKEDQKLTRSRVLNISYHCKGEILPGNIQLNDLFYHVLCMKSYLIKSQRRTSYKGIHFFQLGSPPPNKAKTQFKTFSVLLFCNHIKLNFIIFTSSCNVFKGLDRKFLFFYRFKMFLRIFLFFFLMVLTSCSETKKDTQDSPPGLLQALRSKYLGHIRGKRTVS